MNSPNPNPQEEIPANPEDQPFTSAMRIFGGVTWGTITTLAIAVILILIPQVPRPWLWGVIPSLGWFDEFRSPIAVVCCQRCVS
jgi:hypothetical protein